MREQQSGKTLLRFNFSEICEKIIGLDVYSLYPWAMSQMPVNFYCRRYKEDGFKPHYDVMYSQMYMWLRFREREDKVKIYTRLNLGRD